MDYIDKEEKEIMESYDRDEWVSVSKSKKAEIEEAANISSEKKKTTKYPTHRKRL